MTYGLEGRCSILLSYWRAYAQVALGKMSCKPKLLLGQGAFGISFEAACPLRKATARSRFKRYLHYGIKQSSAGQSGLIYTTPLLNTEQSFLFLA